MRSDLDATTLPQLVAAAAERDRYGLALVSGDRRWTYGDLAAEAARVGGGLRALGVQPGEPIGVLLPNWNEFFSTVYGIQSAGGIAVCLSTLATASELHYALEVSGVRRIVYTPNFLKHDYQAMLDAYASGDTPQRISLETRIAYVPHGPLPPGSLDFSHLGPRPEARVAHAVLREIDRSGSDTPAAIFFTSGSTARPKALVHAHRALVHQALVCSAGFGLDREDRLWGCLPMFFTGGFVAVALTSLAAGAAVILQDHFDAARALDLMEEEGVSFYTGWQLAPALCEHPSFAHRRLRIRKGIFVDTEIAGRLLTPDHVTVGVYGMSETATFVCQARFDDPPEIRRRGFGRPLPGVELRIVDPETGVPCPPGEVGEVIVKGPSMMLGYLDRPLAETLDTEGFFHTGDLGRIDETGALHFAGRLKEVVRTAGVSVSAAEVETCLEELPEVRNAYVVPVPHTVRGENVAAFVVPAPGTTIDPGRLLAHCRRALASYKVPRHLFVLDPAAVPRTGTQKVAKQILRHLAEEQAGGPEDLAIDPCPSTP